MIFSDVFVSLTKNIFLLLVMAPLPFMFRIDVLMVPRPSYLLSISTGIVILQFFEENDVTATGEFRLVEEIGFHDFINRIEVPTSRSNERLTLQG